jgi:hypothetical protein
MGQWNILEYTNGINWNFFLQFGFSLKPVFHFASIVAKRTGEHAQIEKRFVKPRTSGCISVSK